MELFSAHDTTLMGLLMAFGKWEDEWPGYVNIFKIELYKDEVKLSIFFITIFFLWSTRRVNSRLVHAFFRFLFREHFDVEFAYNITMCHFEPGFQVSAHDFKNHINSANRLLVVLLTGENSSYEKQFVMMF